MTERDTRTSQLSLAFEEQRVIRRVWHVCELVDQLRKQIEQEYIDIWVDGEVSNFRAAPSGHMYFTLKDAEAQLPVVLFRRQASLLRFSPEDGLHLLVRGRVSVYAQRGSLQLVAETVEPVGAGSLQLAFEQLKEKLKAEGLFDAARKRSLPPFPRAVGIITSPSGAVIRDFLNIVGRRHSGLEVFLFPASVQGESAPAEIEAALNELNGSNLVDLIVLARGGGSLEDLAAFNSERVARAIAGSRLPVVSAVGHETDFTIADLVADLRAPTPSAAAELITEQQYRVAEHLVNLTNRITRAVRYQLLRAHQRLDGLAADRAQWRMIEVMNQREQHLDDLSARMESTVRAQLNRYRFQLSEQAGSVQLQNPSRRLGLVRARMVACRARLEHLQDRWVSTTSHRLYALDARLRGLSPLGVLSRGYAIVQDAQGGLIRSTTQLAPGDRTTTRLIDGVIVSRVESTERAVLQKKGKQRRQK